MHRKKWNFETSGGRVILRGNSVSQNLKGYMLQKSNSTGKKYETQGRNRPGIAEEKLNSDLVK